VTPDTYEGAVDRSQREISVETFSTTLRKRS
jgi:hypothetical protein